MRRIILIALLTAMASRLAWDEYYRVIITRNYYALVELRHSDVALWNTGAEYQNRKRTEALDLIHEAADLLQEQQRRLNLCETRLYPHGNVWEQARRELDQSCCARNICTPKEMDECSCRDGFKSYCGGQR